MWTPEWQGAFARGQIATIVVGNWFGGLLQSAYAPGDAGKWGVAPAPAHGERRVLGLQLGRRLLGVLETSREQGRGLGAGQMDRHERHQPEAANTRRAILPAYVQAGTAP